MQPSLVSNDTPVPGGESYAPSSNSPLCILHERHWLISSNARPYVDQVWGSIGRLGPSRLRPSHLRTCITPRSYLPHQRCSDCARMSFLHRLTYFRMNNAVCCTSVILHLFWLISRSSNRPLILSLGTHRTGASSKSLPYANPRQSVEFDILVGLEGRQCKLIFQAISLGRQSKQTHAIHIGAQTPSRSGSTDVAISGDHSRYAPNKSKK